MTWLFPLYLLGAAAIIGPILMHLRRRPPQDRVEFSSLMFLDAQPPMPVSKRRLEHWLLLLLRCLALILLALMFARPLWRGEETAALSQNHATLILVDRSASMQRADLWPRAQAEAARLLAAATPADRLALATFDRDFTPLWTFSEDASSASTRTATANQRLQQTRPGWASTDLGLALVQATTLFTSQPGLTGLKKRIIVLTDFQEGTRLDALRSQVWPETIAVSLHRLDAPDSDNLSLSLAATTTEDNNEDDNTASLPTSSPRRPTARLRLSNTRDSKAANFTLAWEKGGAEAITGYLPPGATRVLTAPPIADESQARTLLLTGDAWDFDNRVFIAPPQPRPVHILFIGDESTRNEAASPLFYLSRALQQTPTLLPTLQVIPSSSATSIPAETDIVFTSGTPLQLPLAQALHTFMENGGMVVTVVEDTTTPAILSTLSSAPAAAIALSPAAPSQDYLMLAQVDIAHPLLRPFADERLRDFTKLRFWKHRSLSLSEAATPFLKVIASFDDRTPAILTSSPGKGTLILLTSGWHPADSQLALSTKFVPLLYGWLEAAGFHNEPASSLLVGDAFPQEANTQILTPDGHPLSQSTALTPGLYTITGARTPSSASQTQSPSPSAPISPGARTPPSATQTPSPSAPSSPGARTPSSASQTQNPSPSAQTPRLIAVNLPPEETRITPLEPNKLLEFGLPLDSPSTDLTPSPPEDRERLATTEQEGRQRAWLWLLTALLLLLALETWLSGRIRHPTPQPTYS
ncbi:putative membrane protein (TIGR02226 family) [Prosthecobacter fusiformis]|uniref:Putative membrane protein (TIGR02226 family) n=1 Tax=Prosthecobacter fusiformis TaxID=48464 RepID=A0A4R7RZ79_9BACT|nr:BatA domain-containing protein [Prosthecobacter fusiformis]TDU71264.1 putative membrane protein (TIGR02226 family) [Prosthecobacter fusiformis]